LFCEGGVRVSQFDKVIAGEGVHMPTLKGQLTWLRGAAMVLLAYLLMIVPLFVLFALALNYSGLVGIILAGILAIMIHLWVSFRFFFPAMWKLIWIDGRHAFFVMDRLKPEQVTGIVRSQFAVLGSDLRRLYQRIGSRNSDA
jgi:hypothetical protein